jgi:3-isopropylmalate dehydratase small subunit
VATGIWLGPFTGEVFTLASDVDIDHIIPLRYAHGHSGADWSPLLKKVFANDPDNILVTKDNANQTKGY